MHDQAGGLRALFAPLDSAPRKLPRVVIEQAAEWVACLQCEDSPSARQACAHWRAAHPDHECAWQRMSALALDLGSTRAYSDPALVSTTLDRAAARDSRRNAIKLALLAAGFSTVGWRAAETFGPQWLAEHSTDTGERRTLTLADGTQVVLNTRTAIDVEINDSVRQVRLRRGEILVTTAPDPRHRPFYVHTSSGTLHPIGTRFTARQFDDEDQSVRVAVLEGSVEVTPKARPGMASLVRMGESLCFDAHRILPARTLDTPATETAWDQGMMVANRMPLARFARELGRYRTGVLRCEPKAAQLAVTGAFPVDDTDAALRMLEEVLPVRVSYHTRYWVSIHAA
ncbi:FecR domain-containing protein [Bordetella petrii]|uniref:FecR domain-containing protein n=1 Tax=Bordetella petrii TaxID=94624 RepID=UPI001E371821|nr:FecR domain-containing protein [Bordetella petrii]MCD0504056.1 FecR domain-containing protein [Bordetella petrii]